MPSYEYQQVDATSPWVNTTTKFAVIIGYDINTTNAISVKDPQGRIVDSMIPGSVSFPILNGTFTVPPSLTQYTHQTTGVPNTFIDNTNTIDQAGYTGTWGGTIQTGLWKVSKKLLVPPGYSFVQTALSKQVMVILCATLDDAVAIL